MTADNKDSLDKTHVVPLAADQRQIAQFKIQSQIGSGGMGEVYLAVDAHLQRQVALKLLPPSFASDADTKARFIREAQTAAALNHPNIVTIYQVGEHEGQPYIAMEYIEGLSLRDLMKSQRLPIERVSDFLHQICDGLSVAHSKGIVHRDIKPANILVSTQGRIKILDFGLAKFQHTSGLTHAGMRLGTISYMSPEQAQGVEADQRSDIFSLGVMLYELLTGNLPFMRDNEIATLFAIVHQPYPPLDSNGLNIPIQFSTVIEKALCKDLAARYQTVRQLMDDLWGSAVSTGVTSIAPVSPGLGGGPPSSRVVSRLDLSMAQSSIKKTSLAVLPFENLGPTDHEYFADGVTEELTTSLAKIKELRVISYNSSRHFRRPDASISAIGRELGVEFLLTGTIRWDKSGETSRFRLSCKLVNTADESLIWTETYDHVLDKIFVLQSELAERVTKALGFALGSSELENLAPNQTANLEAYDYYLRGNEFFPRSTAIEDLNKAIEMYGKAVELDPDFALAYAKLSWAHSTMYWFFHDRTKERVNLAKVAVEKATKIVPNLPESKLALGYYYYYACSDYERALEQFLQASESRPNDTSLLAATGFVQRRLGRWSDALRSIRKASQLDPRSGLFNYEVGNTYLYMRRYDEAINAFDRAISLVPDWADAYSKQAMATRLRDGSTDKAVDVFKKAAARFDASEIVSEWNLLEPFAAFCAGSYPEAVSKLFVDETEMELHFLYKGLLLLLDGQTDAARNSFDSARVLLQTKIKSQPESARVAAFLGMAYAGLGKKDEAFASGIKATELHSFSKDNVFGVVYLETLALIYTLTGEHDQALDQLEFLLSVPSTVSKAMLQQSALYSSLRDHPRFNEILQS